MPSLTVTPPSVPGASGELGQRQQADRWQGVGQPERLLDVDFLELEVVIGGVMVVVVSHAMSLSARMSPLDRKSQAQTNERRPVYHGTPLIHQR